MSQFYAKYPVLGGTGVTGLNGLTGSLTLVAGTGISITPAGTNITITNTSPSLGGTVTNFSFTNGNGFTGTVTNPTTTPALSLTGTLTGDITGTLTATALTATTNSTLTTLSALSLPYSQLTGAPTPLTFTLPLVNTSGTVSANVFAGPAPVTGAITWTAVTGATTGSGGSITDTATSGWGNSGAFSSQSFTSGSIISFTFLAGTVGLCGFSATNTGNADTDVQFGINFSSGVAIIYESAVAKYTIGPSTTSDVFSVKLSLGQVFYYKNGTLVYTSSTTPASTLYGKTSIHDNGTGLSSASFSTPGTTNGTSGIVPAPLAGQENYFLQGNGSWNPVPSIIYANQSLSNLTSPTSVNQDLLSNGATTLGELGTPWPNEYITTLSVTSSGILWGTLNSNVNTGFGIQSTFPGNSANPGGPLSITTINTPTYASGNITIATGNASSSTSGNIVLQTGTASTIRGSIQLNALYAILPMQAADPTGTAGAIYYNTTSNTIRWYNGTVWATLV